MEINFIPNDPLAIDFVPMRRIEPQPDRKSRQAGFTISRKFGAGLFSPGTPEFLFWQAREAALVAIQVWEQFNGPLKRWSASAVNPLKLNLIPDGGDDLNAYYDRKSVAFFHHTTDGHATFSAASTDVVAHELGHAFLDTLRPELFGSPLTEYAAFHEAFADCIAILTALFDRETRQTVLSISPDLEGENFVETIAEDLSDGTRRAYGPSHPASAPRHAMNNFKFELPTTLLTIGPPADLTSEAHSFGRIFSGCFYDLVRNIFKKGADRDEGALLSAARTAGKLLIDGAKEATLTSRFFQSVGRAMVLADDAVYGGVNRHEIGNAFKRHGVLLGAMGALMPQASLAGRAPRSRTRFAAALLDPATLKDIRRRIDAPPKARLSINSMVLGGNLLLQATHEREIPLDKLATELKGVVAIAPEAVVIGGAGSAAAVFGVLPDLSTTTDEVLKFVETLLTHKRIAFKRTATRAKVAAVATVGGTVTRSILARETPSPLPTHRIITRRGKKVLTRTRFLCSEA